MHPTAARTNRSSIQSSISSTSAPSSLLHPQQQQILYGPVANPTLTLQPCGSGLHPSCIYPGPLRNTALTNPSALHIQGKSNRWPPKSKLVRNQQYCQQQQQHQHIQQQLSYNQKPVVLYDQTNNVPPPAPTASFLIASSTYTHGSFSGDQYNNSGVALIPQSYYKPPDIQTFCLVQDRQSIQQQQQEQPSHGSYYNISSTNTCNLQAINGTSTFQFPALSPYATTGNFPNNQLAGPVQTVHSNQIFSNPSASLVFGGLQRDKPVASSATLDVSALKVAKSKIPGVNNNQQSTQISSENFNDWPSQVIAPASSNLYNVKSGTDVDTSQEIIANSVEKITPTVATKGQEEHYSDESLASFDFTIEAEKMVSALCNTSSNDLGKEEAKNDKSNATPLFNGAGDTASNKNTWFTEFCPDYGTGTSIAVQTDGPCSDRSQFPELLRKVVYWGCTEAEIALNNSPKTNLRSAWLKNLSIATKTAVTKSSTCFPIFAGDRIFVNDLINALLRISNGWLILDNYLNKQHYPSLDDKFDCELVRCFRLWEESTHELLNQIVQAFLKLEENNDVSGFEQKTELFGTSFPGDVSVYTNHDLFDPPSSTSKHELGSIKNGQDSSCNVAQLSSESLRNFSLYNVSQEKQSCQKESKLRSKWTVTENLTTVDSTKSVPDVFSGHAESGGQTNSRFRSRGNSSSTKTDTSTQSLNAEFFHLRSKVLTENNQDSPKQWLFKEKKQEIPESKVSSHDSIDPIFRLQRQLDENYESNYAQKCLSRVDSSFLSPSISLESMYFPSNNDHENFYPYYAVCPPYSVDYGSKGLKGFEQSRGSKANMDLVYVGKSSTSQLELAAVPKDKMTLLSQIEPSIPEKSSEEMTANLSAWFASMRNSDNRQIPFINLPDANTETVMSRMQSRPEIPKSTMDLSNCIRQLQIDANRQFQTLQNMQSVQTTPWNAYNLISNRVQVQQVPEEYDSSEDIRVYMKPGSYNVPKKRHQRKSNRRLDNSSSRNTTNTSSNNHRNHYVNKEKMYCTPASSTPVPRSAALSAPASLGTSSGATVKLPFPATPIVPPPTFSLENSPRILKRSDTCSYTVSEDITWKAACASAEILLEALNVKEDTDAKKNEVDRTVVNETNENDNRTENGVADGEIVQNQEKFEESYSKTLKDDNDGCGGVSSYEASEDDSGSTYHFSPNTSINDVSQLSSNKNGSSKMNVKTDSWLIKTLNNANMANKQKRRKSCTDPHSSESSNSSVTENENASPVVSLVTNSTVTTVATTTVKNLQQTVCSRKSSCISLNNNQGTSEETERVVGKATYSETVRRCASLSASFSEKKEFCKKSKLNIANVSTICSTVIPIPGRKCQKKDYEKSYYLLHSKSRKCFGKKFMKTCDIADSQTEGASKSMVQMKHGKKKENGGCIEFLDGKLGGKNSDRGWSIWYSSKRKQSLSPLALSKLETIHQTVWQMEEAEVFKCPSSTSGSGTQASTHTIEDYCKVIKSPMFLETVEYKLKNRVYHKVEHVVRDFRRIVYNSKLYHKDDHDRVKMIDILSKKLEELFEEHFASWDFDNISGSPRESSPVLHRFKSPGQKQTTGHYSHNKNSPTSSATENV